MIKRVINTNISLQDAFTNMIEASVANILVQKGIENGDASPVTDLGDVKKKGSSGKVVSVSGVACNVKKTTGEIIEVICSNGIYSAVVTIGDEISFDYDENGVAYLYYIENNTAISTLTGNLISIDSSVKDSDDGTILLTTGKSDGRTASLLSLTKGGISLQSDSGTINYGGLIKIEELTNKLNKLLDAIKNLELAFNIHTHPVSGTVAGVSTSQPKDVQLLQKFNRDNYENTKIIHKG